MPQTKRSGPSGLGDRGGAIPGVVIDHGQLQGLQALPLQASQEMDQAASSMAGRDPSRHSPSAVASSRAWKPWGRRGKRPQRNHPSNQRTSSEMASGSLAKGWEFPWLEVMKRGSGSLAKPGP